MAKSLALTDPFMFHLLMPLGVKFAKPKRLLLKGRTAALLMPWPAVASHQTREDKTQVE